MGRHYSREELMKLKESPLVSKPSGLRPAEEWMGPIPDQTQNGTQSRGARGITRGKTEEGFDSQSGRRPAFEARGKSTTAPEDIVLGPPKTAFASASGRTTSRPAVANQHDEAGTNDRSSHRDRYARDGQRHERDDAYSRDNKSGQPAHRRSLKEDAEMWSSARQPKNITSDDKEKFTKRSGDRDHGRDRESGGDRRTRGFENHRREGDWETNADHLDRPNEPMRSHDAPSWGRNADRPWEEDDRSDKSRAREYRDRDRKGIGELERGWCRGAQQDEDPLWMDGLEGKSDRKQAPTQADFEEFRAKMKAQAAKDQGASPQKADRTSSHDCVTSGGPRASKSKLETPLDLGDLSDKFYDILSQPKQERAVPNGQAEDSQQNSLNTAAAKMAKSSKFSRLFRDESTSKPGGFDAPPEITSSEDRAGFQRILKLLDQQQQPSSIDEASARASTMQNPQVSPPVQSPPFKPQDEMHSPPLSTVPKTRDSEFLLNLMRQPQQQSQHDMPQTNSTTRRDRENLSGMLPFSHFAMSPPAETPQQTTPSGPPPGFFDEPPRQELLPRDKLNPNASNQRGAPPGLYDLFNNPQRPTQGALPPGLERRPPGFDQMHPGFGQHPPQRQGMPPPPPGFPPAQRGPGVVGPAMFPSRPNGPGPGLPPPPGFINMGGPPPGFPGMGYGHDGPPFGGGGGGFDYGQGFPPPGQQRR